VVSAKRGGRLGEGEKGNHSKEGANILTEELICGDRDRRGGEEKSCHGIGGGDVSLGEAMAARLLVKKEA